MGGIKPFDMRIQYTKEVLDRTPWHDLWAIAAALGVEKSKDGKYGRKSELIPKILEAQKRHPERIRPYCEMCGHYVLFRERAHICAEGDDDRENILMLCDTCHRMFDALLKPRLYVALRRYGIKNLPRSWRSPVERIR